MGALNNSEDTLSFFFKPISFPWSLLEFCVRRASSWSAGTRREWQWHLPLTPRDKDKPNTRGRHGTILHWEGRVDIRIKKVVLTFPPGDSEWKNPFSHTEIHLEMT